MQCNCVMRQTKILLPQQRGRDIKRNQVGNIRNCKQYIQQGAEQVCHPVHPVAKECHQLPTEDVQQGVSGHADGATGKAQIIKLPATMDVNSPTAANDGIIQTKLVKAVGKSQMKLSKSPMKAYATVYGQCSQEVKDKLKGTDDWGQIQRMQLLLYLVQKINCCKLLSSHGAQEKL
jgi:hypothetical protein